MIGGGRYHTVNDQLLALDAFSLTLPSVGYLIGLIIFGIAGYVAWRYGKKMSLPTTKWMGVRVYLDTIQTQAPNP